MIHRLIQGAIPLALAFGLTPAWGQDTPAMPDMDHSQMDHSQMGHGTAPAADDGGTDRPVDHGSMQGGSPPPDARDPHAWSGGYTLDPARPLRMADEHYFFSLMIDRLEVARSEDHSTGQYELQARYGRDYDRLVLKAEGEADDGRLEEASTELLWSRAVAAYWDAQLGVRHDSGEEGPDRNWLAVGIQGLAPYWFELDATAYLGEDGRTAFRLEAEYELLLTQKLVLQPRLEASFYGREDDERELGTGLSSLTGGLRLRYEIRREFAPYVGIEWSGKYGGTADHAKSAGQDVRETRWVAGLRAWW